MSAKEYLNQGFRINERIDAKIEQIGMLRALAAKTSVTLTDMPGDPNKGRSRTEEMMVKILTLEEEINEDIDRLVDLKADIMHKIAEVEDVECRMLLEKRYLLFETWEQIAGDMGYTVRNIYNLHGRALGLVCV